MEIYLTTEQIQRLAALSLDAQVGMQIGSDLTSGTVAYVTVATRGHVDNDHYEVYADGTYRNVT